MSYEKFYPGGWQSGESGGTPITPEALNHIENGIEQTYSDFAPAQEDASFPGCYYRMVNGIKEWINPPMVENVEYRTTERIDGKAVYKKKTGGLIYYRREGDEAAMTPTGWMDGIFNRINGVNMRSLYFGENTTTRMQLYGRGAYLVGVTFNGGSGALYIIYADSSNQPLSRVHRIDSSGDQELGFVLDTSNGELEITCPQQWCYGFIIGSGASIGWV